MRLLKHLFDNNEAWAKKSLEQDPEFFARLVHQQTPKFFWIGCSDSRVPANEITGLAPGEVFVHRNIANLMAHRDANSCSGLQYAVDVLQVEHVIVTGHYACGGVRAAMDAAPLSSPLAEWLAPLRAIYHQYEERLAKIADMRERWDKLCELNVMEQVRATSRLPVIRAAWAERSSPAIHGWIYNVADGRLRDLNVTVTAADDAEALVDAAIESALG